MAAGNRATDVVVVLVDGQDQALAVAVAGRIKAVRALHDIPAVVAAAHDDIDFLPFVLADVAGPQLARQAVKAEAPEIRGTTPASPSPLPHLSDIS